MPRQGQYDHFELSYMADLNALLSHAGVPLTYTQDRAAIDTGLHLFVEGSGNDFQASDARVWFQAKGKRSATLSVEQFDSSSWIKTDVDVEHLRYWFAAPEPVYLVIYVESKQVFIAEDVRDIVYRMWPRGDFYSATGSQKSVRVRLDKTAVLNDIRIKKMLEHRSMRIDGPAFQGRPLGHLFDPLRSELSFGGPELWEAIVARLLKTYRYRSTTQVSTAPGITILRGLFYDTMMWQSSAYSEIGFSPNDDFRSDPPVVSLHGEAIVIIDAGLGFSELAEGEVAALRAQLGTPTVPIVLFFFGKELSQCAGAWRRFLRENYPENDATARMIGIESLTSMVLVATLVYLDFAPQLSFRFVNYRYEK